MERVAKLKKQLKEYTTSLYIEGYLNEQFSQLQQLQDETDPKFVFEVVSLFFVDSEQILNQLSNSLNQPNVDFRKVEADIHQFKGTTSSIGAQSIQKSCDSLGNYCKEQNLQRCLMCLQQMNTQYFQLKSKLENLFKMEQDVIAAEGSIP